MRARSGGCPEKGGTTLSTTDLARALGDLQEDEVVAGVGERIAAGDDPTAILADVQRGMELGGKRFGDGAY